jgi:hypothetical protein
MTPASAVSGSGYPGNWGSRFLQTSTYITTRRRNSNDHSKNFHRLQIFKFHITLFWKNENHAVWCYEGESNENRKTEIKIRNIAPLSYKLADMLPML